MTSLHELFKWGIEHGGLTEKADEQPKKQLSDFDRNFLNAAMRTDASKMKGLFDIYEDEQSTLEEKEVVLEDLEFFVQTIDNACDLPHKTVDGLRVLMEAVQYRSEKADAFNSSEVRMRAAWILATSFQNNPKLQSDAQNFEALKNLTKILNQEIEFYVKFVGELKEGKLKEMNEEKEKELTQRGDLSLISKLVSAISPLIESKPGIKQFREEGGFHSLNQLLRVEQESIKELDKVIRKAVLNRERRIFTKESDQKTIERITKIEEEEAQKTQDSDLIEVEDDARSRGRELEKRRAKLRLERNWEENNGETFNRESDYSLWLRYARRTVFILRKLMESNEELKFAFVKDSEGETIKTLSFLLQNHKEDADLREKTALIVDSLLNGNKLAQFAVEELKKSEPQFFPSLLENAKEALKLETEDCVSKEKLQSIVKQLSK